VYITKQINGECVSGGNVSSIEGISTISILDQPVEPRSSYVFCSGITNTKFYPPIELSPLPLVTAYVNVSYKKCVDICYSNNLSN
jgi:hypothetical protein